MKILITGSSGTIGRLLMLELIKRGHEVRGIDLKHSNNPLEIRCDIAESRQLLIAFEKLHDNHGFIPDFVFQ